MPTSILLIQPDAAQSRRLHQLLFDLGFESRTVKTGEDALALMRGGKPVDLVVTELSLPGMDGFRLLEELRKLRKPGQTAAVVISAFPGMLNKALRLKHELGLAAVASSNATAVTLNEIFSAALRARPAGAKSASMQIPTEAFSALSKGKEAKRLARIAALHLTQDIPQDEALQKLVRETAQAFDFPVALISVLLEDKQFFKSHVGLKGKLAEDRSLPRDWSFCAHVVEAERPTALIVPDARKHPSFEDNPLVLSGLVGSYVGAPIVTVDQLVLGTLCLVDHKPRQITPDELDLLTALTRRVAGEIELRHLKQDRSQQWDKSQEREEQLAMLKAALESLHLGIMLHDSRRRIVLANDRLCEMLGFDRSYVEKSDCESFHVDLLALLDDPDPFAHKMKILDEGPYVANEVFEMQRPRRQILRWTARPINVGEEWYELCTYEDLTAEIDLEVSRDRLATIDPVTELLNRRGAEEEAAREAERARRKKRAYTVLRFELNGLVVLNHQLGHAEGDAALKAVADCLRRCLRVVDRPCRWGGRQFMVLLPETGEAEARLVAERIRKAIEKLPTPLPLSVTGGLAYSDKDPDFSNCLEFAERKLALARSSSPGVVL